MMKKVFSAFLILFCFILFATCVTGLDEDPESEPDYEKVRYHKKVFEPNGNFIRVSSDVELYKETQEAEDEKVGVTVSVKKTQEPCFFPPRRDFEVTVQCNDYMISYEKDNHMWSVDRSVEVETKHSELGVGFEWGNDGRIIALNNIPIVRNCDVEPSEPVGSDEDDYDDEEEKDELVYRKEHHFDRDIGFGEASIDTSVIIVQEPQETNDTDGFEIEFSIDWHEPLYYMGSTKQVSITYNGYGIEFTKDGPDAGMNGCTSVEVTSRHVSAEITTGYDTGVYPNVHY